MTPRARIFAVVCAAVALVGVACEKQPPPKPAISGDIAKGNPTEAEVAAVEPQADAPEARPLTPERQAQLDAALAAVPAQCDVFSEANCLLPFPNDFFTVQDDSTGTRRRINLPPGQLPNVSGSPLDPSEWNRNDGWSPNTPILIQVPNFDPSATNLPKQTDIEFSTTSASATVIVDLDTGQLVPHWAEMDQRATSPSNQALILRPATSLIETHRFAVGLRNLIGTSGVPLPAPITFQALRDNNLVPNARISSRQEEYNLIFTEMAKAGVDRSNLYLMWHFTVAGADTLAGRVLSMREDAFGRLAGTSPAYTITGVQRDGLQKGVNKVVRGTFEVPLYLDRGGAPGARMVYSPLNGDPLAVGTYTASFTCVVPTVAIAKGEAAPVVYGHGLLGSSDEVLAGSVQATAAANNAVYCATNWIGLSEQDVGEAVRVLGDLSEFPTIPDRLQQSMLNTLFLGRLMLNEDGLGGNAEFQTKAGANIMNTDEAFYDGNSQGAIMGAAVTAVAQDWTKAVLGVGGMNYSTLLNRSTDFDQYFSVMRGAYPDPLDQQILFGLIQMLWDRGEAGGYVQHLTTRTYDLTPPKQVLMTVALGDHQVATVTADNIARTLKLPIYQPVLPKGVQPIIGTEDQSAYYFNLDPIRKFPLQGSALYYWYFGTLPAPQGNITPTMSDEYEAACTGANAGSAATDPQCEDPHEFVRSEPRVIAQKKAFLKSDGVITNVCKDEPCVGKPTD